MTNFNRVPKDYWEDDPSEKVLADVFSEMGSPIKTIVGFSRALLIPDLSEELRMNALEAVVENAEFVESIWEAIGGYLEKFRDQ